MGKIYDKNLERHKQWARENTIHISLCPTAKSGIPDALRKMTEATGMTANQYTRQILEEMLRLDGYLDPEMYPGK